jgi:hypothetical protein
MRGLPQKEGAAAGLPERGKEPEPPQSYWLWVLGLIGLDYFSTLAYQPSIAFEAAGSLAPLATLVVVAVTLFAAVPVYAYVAGKSHRGQGALGLLERCVQGWHGKLLILVLLGFAATDFVITRTLSLADAAAHVVNNPIPLWQQALDSLSQFKESLRPLSDDSSWHRILNIWDRQMVVTVLLVILSLVFWKLFRKGFTRRVIVISAYIVGLYLLVNGLVICSGLFYLQNHPDIVAEWWEKVGQGHLDYPALANTGNNWWALAGLCLLLFPKMALGLSGFELSMVVMPLVSGKKGDQADDPRGRIGNTRKLLLTAAGIMSLYLLGSALVTTTLIPSNSFTDVEAAKNRALAYLAHGGLLADGATADQICPIFGPLLGTLYDLSTVMILGLAGTSVAIGLRDFVPSYLHRLGMELNLAHRMGATLLIFNLINLYVTVVFRASVTAQRGAYAASVLVLMSSAALAALLDRWQRRSGPWLWRMPWFYLLVTAGFSFASLVVMAANLEGLKIAFWFILAIVLISLLSRVVRSTELRFEGFQFKDEQSKLLWECMEDLQIPVLVPHRPGRRSLAEKEQQIRQRHRLTPDVYVVFVEAELGDASDFYHRPLLEVIQEEGRFIVRITHCASVSHVIAAVALELCKSGRVPEIHFGWSDENPLAANLNFILFGQGNVPWMVRELIRKAEPKPECQPRIVIG